MAPSPTVRFAHTRKRLGWILILPWPGSISPGLKVYTTGSSIRARRDSRWPEMRSIGPPRSTRICPKRTRPRYYLYYGQRDFTAALAEFQKAEQGLPGNVDILEAMMLIQRRLGHWDEAVAAGGRAVELDPRSIDSAIVLATTYGWMRRFPEVLAIADRILALDPSNADAPGMKISAFRSMGILTRRTAVLRARRAANFVSAELYCGCEEFQKDIQRCRRDRLALGGYGVCQQRTGNVVPRGKLFNTRSSPSEAARAGGAESFPSGRTAFSLGVADAWLGDATSAVAEGEKGMAMNTTSENLFDGPKEEEFMARIYAILGDADHAVLILEQLLKKPYAQPITPGLLRIQPSWDRIRNDPRFQELAWIKAARICFVLPGCATSAIAVSCNQTPFVTHASKRRLSLSMRASELLPQAHVNKTAGRIVEVVGVTNTGRGDGG